LSFQDLYRFLHHGFEFYSLVVIVMLCVVFGKISVGQVLNLAMCSRLWQIKFDVLNIYLSLFQSWKNSFIGRFLYFHCPVLWL